jgi:hypothetical protein
LRSTTRLIQVSVVVHDGRRRAVLDPKAAGFEIVEGGKLQPVSLFSVGRAPTDPSVEAGVSSPNRA